MRAAAQSVLSRLDAGDRSLFLRWMLRARPAPAALGAWRFITHAGGAAVTIAASLLPLLLGGPLGAGARRALPILAVSHLVVQAIKRTVGRPRPSARLGLPARVSDPDRFSFPSGHACAAMAVAIGYAAAYPPLALPLVSFAALVGISRVVLGVHYPGDVLAGQLIAWATALLLLPVLGS